MKVGSMKTVYVNPEKAPRDWWLVDAKDKTLGRVAAEVAAVLRGKKKPHFVPHQEIGDYVVVINAGKVVVSGNKEQDKMYHFHSRFPGGMKNFSFAALLKRRPEAPLEIAIRGMLPKNRLGRKLFNNVKVYADEKHPHVAQKPRVLEIKE